ncbi:hypothetical protein WR25_26511 [Diploscapter pachys]|uniref:Uncharacterized protein n=1 Tax=Diploscapter pachys TaxID=2018661 RepID=A0A2A2LIT7_9BILA|nr:hypothetical protein WR25_26511 [Diploscapter pachys]
MQRDAASLRDMWVRCSSPDLCVPTVRGHGRARSAEQRSSLAQGGADIDAATAAASGTNEPSPNEQRQPLSLRLRTERRSWRQLRSSSRAAWKSRKRKGNLFGKGAPAPRSLSRH